MARTTRPPLIYIAGPYTAETNAEIAENIHRAMMVGVEVAQLGGMPVIPHTNTPLPFLDVQTPEFWYRGTEALLLASDAVVFIDGWTSSAGAVREYKIAQDGGLEPFAGRNIEDGTLAEWIREYMKEQE